MQTVGEKEALQHSFFTENILACCFDVMNELGVGFLENVYKNALYLAMQQKGLQVAVEQHFEVKFRNQRIGKYIADLIVENVIVIELKCCKKLLPEHQAQLINYLKVTGLRVGLLVNFGNRKIEFKRVHHPDYFLDEEEFNTDHLR